ncbi:hypothetical protein DFJ74DRAFT_673639 [Hyaloraphidium curvatum]|nr:hypothetical protein DFJ74DRAFT_673639 [Hyaloraphidium curvatum]
MALWEVQKYNATDIFANVPDDLIGGYMYFNVPVAKGKGEGREFNAIAAMKHRLRKAEKVADRMLGPLEGARTPKAELKGATGSPGTYVVFKLDVDHSPTENAVMRRLAELVPGSGTGEIEVQELFFEHHTAIDEIVDGWCWAPGGRCPTLAESYDLFAGLRKVGIRAHSWI